ncbi:MAG: FtsQ-type POTRA domain-containing protein [Candidatus Nealsonbacteria bacterium]|nr:FtsQ-type POTRA domain-containing protein [Candidatus Nealsonbacteria bacterium]
MEKYSYRKAHRYKKKKPICSKRFLFLGTLSLIFIGGIFYLLFLSAVFQVEKIIVSGEKKVFKEEIEVLAERRLENTVLFFKTKSIFAVDINQIKEDILQSFPQIAEAELGRDFFNAISIVVSERTAVALWCQDKECFLIDKQGVIFEEVSAEADLLKIEGKRVEPFLTLGLAVIEPEELLQIFEVRTKLIEIADISVNKAVIVSQERLDVKTIEGWEIYFNPKRDLDWQIRELALVLEKQISSEKRRTLEYVDLRFSRVYYK